jgi:excinuclease ABC subunit C
LIDEHAYAEDVEHATLFLRGREDDVVQTLTRRMQAAAEARHYEQAAMIRDQVRALSRVQARQYVESNQGVDADVVACAEQGGAACVNLAMIRSGRHVGDRSFFPTNADAAGAAEVLQAFLEQHYVEQPKPALVLASHAVEFPALVPTQGERRVWVEMALKNAQLALQQRVREKSAQETRLAALREALHLPETVQRVECFDISHTMGEATVASCVVYDRYAMQRGEYRRFNVRDAAPGDDYAAMRHVMARRYERVNAEGGKVPDLVLVDGGQGQARVARAVLAELGLNDVSVVGVAKGPERKAGLEALVVEAEGVALSLPPTHPGLHLVQQIRDEAHRFAVLGHRARRARSRTASVLTQIPGIGAQRRQRLLAHFGGVREVQAAAIDELMQVTGISRPLAERIYKALH